MPGIDDKKLLREFTRLSPALTAAEARQRLSRRPYGSNFGVVVGDDGAALACLRDTQIGVWPDDQTLDALRARWPALRTLPEDEVVHLGLVARFFNQDFTDHLDLPGVVLVDATGRPTAILTRRTLDLALADLRPPSGTRGAGSAVLGEPAPRDGGPAVPIPREGELMVTRYGRLRFPAQAALRQRRELIITVNRAQAGVPGQVELGLTAREWPLRVTATLVGIRPEDFTVDGPSGGVIEVPRTADSLPLTFTLTPQSLGKKEICVLFEQGNDCMTTATIATEVVETLAAPAGDAEVINPPSLASTGLPADVTIYITRLDAETYGVLARTAADNPDSPPREVDRISFKKGPDAFMDEIYQELNQKTKGGLTPAQFDEEVKIIGANLYDSLFREDGFKRFYAEEMYGLPGQPAVQIISDEPYVPWEIMRPSRIDPATNRWESDEFYFCERFALSRWLAGPQRPGALALQRVAIVAPPSNLQYVQDEIDAIKRLPGLQVTEIKTLAELRGFLQNGSAEIVHFACHGKFEGDDPGRSAVQLGSGEYLRPRDLVAEYRNFARGRPLVFLNACDSGRVGLGLTGVDGWAQALNKAEVGFFIGSVWKTTDALACAFARTFYERLQAGDTVGLAMLLARKAIARAGDATYLSYTLYAHPRARAVAR